MAGDSALAQYSRRLKFLVAFRPGVLSPTLAAQQVSTYQRFTGNRLALNVVTGGDGLEMRRYGDNIDKSARYRRTGEFLAVVRGIWTDPDFSYRGDFYTIEHARMAYPLEVTPTIYFGGSSPEAIEVAAQYADVYLTWAETPDQVAEKTERVRVAAARHGCTLRFGLRLHTVARPTDEEAWRRAVGSYATVAAVLKQYAQLGISEFILSGYPQSEEIRQVGQGVLPLFTADAEGFRALAG